MGEEGGGGGYGVGGEGRVEAPLAACKFFRISCFPCFTYIINHQHTLKQRNIRSEPRIKLNHNIYLKPFPDND